MKLTDLTVKKSKNIFNLNWTFDRNPVFSYELAIHDDSTRIKEAVNLKIRSCQTHIWGIFVKYENI